MAPLLESAAGVVIAALSNAMFKIELDDGAQITAYLAGKIKLSKTKMLIGDRVLVRRSGLKLGRIVYRYRP